jgi:hypothetical protein
MIGPGKYDDLATEARERAKAQGAILIVIQGEHGSGFSCQATLQVTLELPKMLREMADEIEKDLPQ